MARNPFTNYLESFLANTGHAAAPTLEDSLNYIASGAKKGDPAMLAKGHDFAREGLNNVFMVDVGGGKLVNLAPNAPRIQVQTPDGRILQFPKSKINEAQQAGKVLNFKPEQIEAALPPAPPKPAPAPTIDTNPAVAAAIARAAAEVPAQRAAVAAAAKGEDALQYELGKANAFKAAGNRESLAQQAGVGTDTVDLRHLLGEGASPVPPAVQLAKDTAAGARPIPIAGTEAAVAPVAPAAEAVEEAATAPFRPGARNGPWDAPRSVPSANVNPITSARMQDAAEAAALERVDKATGTLTKTLPLAMAAPALGAVGYNTLTPERIERFRDFMNSPPSAAGQMAPSLDSGTLPDTNFTPSTTNFTPRRDLPPEPEAPEANATPISEAAKNMLRQRLNSFVVTPENADDGEPGFTTPKAQSVWDIVDRSAKPVGSPSPAPQPAPPAPSPAPPAPRPTPASSPPGFDKNDIRPLPQPPQRPEAAPSATRSSFSDLLGKIYDPNFEKGTTSKQLFQAAQNDPDNPAAYARAAARWKEENPDFQPDMSGAASQSGGNMKRGGTAKAGGMNPKDAVLHKALDIIHAMMTRNH